jgi:excisionase family DNA binding protein
MSFSLPRDALTTKQAGVLLGLSVTTIQKMAINGEISAWVTPGGHRRIPYYEVERLLAKASKVSSTTLIEVAIVPKPRLRVLLAEDDPIQVQFFKNLTKRCPYPIDINVVNDASAALIQLERQRPDLLVTDLLMTPRDGFHLVAHLEKDSFYSKLDVLMLSALDRLEANTLGTLPDWITFHQKPINPDRLLGFLDAIQSRLLRKTAKWMNE